MATTKRERQKAARRQKLEMEQRANKRRKTIRRSVIVAIVAILVVGAHYSSRYELYAHEHIAARSGLSDAKIATIVAGERPVDLTREESIAYDVASKLVRGGQLPEATYQAALSAFGEQGTAELVHLIAGY